MMCTVANLVEVSNYAKRVRRPMNNLQVTGARDTPSTHVEVFVSVRFSETFLAIRVLACAILRIHKHLVIDGEIIEAEWAFVLLLKMYTNLS